MRIRYDKIDRIQFRLWDVVALFSTWQSLKSVDVVYTTVFFGCLSE